ncbi:hypothetical protein DPMN_039709 [Dreissena polymorpha]|uniref:Uncharacterized protein n=1 Tax=Dreissena polymorpha TaxID=45954 RepID=A0A9D4HUI5_DREPO|nr:hypothetical protein DPMN_039709 [Dreissena polymorpha]
MSNSRLPEYGYKQVQKKDAANHEVGCKDEGNHPMRGKTVPLPRQTRRVASFVWGTE